MRKIFLAIVLFAALTFASYPVLKSFFTYSTTPSFPWTGSYIINFYGYHQSYDYNKGMYLYNFAVHNYNDDLMIVDWYKIDADTIYSDSVNYTINYSIDTNTIDSSFTVGLGRTYNNFGFWVDSLGTINIAIHAQNNTCYSYSQANRN